MKVNSFLLKLVENMLVKELLEALLCNACINVIVHLNGNTDAVAFSDAEAACKGHIILEMMLGYSILKQLHDFGRAFDVA